MGLILERHVGQAILIGDEIEVTVTYFGGIRVVLNIKASSQFGGNREWTGKIGDTVAIGTDISITVANMTTGTTQVKLKVDAPRHLKISRKDPR